MDLPFFNFKYHFDCLEVKCELFALRKSLHSIRKTKR